MSHPLAPAELLRSGYAVTFRSVYTGFRCYQSITGARDGLLRSTVNPVEIAFWPTREDLFAWLQDLGYRLDDPVPIGIGYMRVGIITTSHDLVDPEIDRGTLFEVPAGIKPRPAAHVIPPAPRAMPEPQQDIPRNIPAEAEPPPPAVRRRAGADRAPQGLLF